MAEQEIIPDIIAAMRDEGCAGDSSVLEWVGAKMRDYADRLEAAHEREAVTRRNQLGDAAKLREAAVTVYSVLEKLRPFSLDLGDIGRRREFSHLVCLAKNRLDVALSAPPRNCDLYETADEARQAWLDDAGNWDELGSPRLDLYEWLFAAGTEKEGGNDGK